MAVNIAGVRIDIGMVVQIIAWGAFLWLGLFILSRAIRQTQVTLASFVGLASQATFFASSVIIDHPSTTSGTGQPIALDVDTLVRLFWWNNCLPIAVWFHMTTAITRRNRPGPVFPAPIIAVYASALVMTLLGTFTDFVINYAQSRTAGPGFILFVLYLAAAGGGALWNLWRTYTDARRERRSDPELRALVTEVRLVLAGGVLFLVGALYLALVNLLDTYGYNAPGDLCALIGLGLLGYGLVHYDMLAEGKNVRRDFLYALVGVTSVNLIYIVPLALVGAANQFTLLLIIGLATATHSTVDFWRERLDVFFFSRTERDARRDARSFATDLGSLPAATPALAAAVLHEPPPPAPESPADAAADSPPEADAVAADDEKSFNDLVRKAITGLKSQPQLVRSPLLGLRKVEQQLFTQGLTDNRLNRAAVLREILLEMIERLRPAEQGADPSLDALRFYTVLYYPYVRAISHKAALGEAARLRDERKRRGERDPAAHEQTLMWLADVDENTFYKWQRRASDTIAATLRDEERHLRGLP